jgi:hypothetical protein
MTKARSEPLSAGGTDATLFKPSSPAFLAALGKNAAASAVLLIFVAAQIYRVRNSPDGQLVTVITLVGVVLFALGWQWLYLANARINVDRNTLTYTNRWGAKKVFQLADVSGMAVRSVPQLGPGRPIQHAIIYGRNHRTLFRLLKAYWAESDLLDLGRRLGGHQEEVATTASRLDSEFPGSRSFWERHATWIVILAALAVVVGIIALTPPSR